MNSNRIIECTALAEEILRNFEMSEIPMQNIILKAVRLYRLLGYEEGLELFLHESGGYARTPKGIDTQSWKIGKLAGRHYLEKVEEETKEYMFCETLAELKSIIDSNNERLRVAADPPSLGSDMSSLPAIREAKNTNERSRIMQEIKKTTARYHNVQGYLYSYIVKTYNELKYGNAIEDIFTEHRLVVDQKLGELCPEAIAKFVSVYENIDSRNPEDWANAVHSCRRILKDFADKISPASDAPQQLLNGKTVKLGEDNIINRLIFYVDKKSDSKTYASVIGTTIRHFGERLDAVFNAVNKGTHTDLTQIEAKRYIFYTYMTISDIITLMQDADIKGEE